MNNRHFANAPHFYCGTGRPDDHISEQATMLVRFRSDASIERTGFTVTAKLITACQRNYTSLAGRIFSTTLATCDTHITMPQNYTIALFFTNFNLYPLDPQYKCSKEAAPLKVRIYMYIYEKNAE